MHKRSRAPPLGAPTTLQRDVAVLALGLLHALRLQGAEGADQLRASFVWDDHVVDVSALGRRVRVGEAGLVVGDQLVAALLRRRRGLDVAPEDDVDRTLGA